MEINQIKKQELSETYLIEQSKCLVSEFTKLKDKGLASEEYINEKLGNIVRFLQDVGMKVTIRGYSLDLQVSK